MVEDPYIAVGPSGLKEDRSKCTKFLFRNFKVAFVSQLDKTLPVRTAWLGGKGKIQIGVKALAF